MARAPFFSREVVTVDGPLFFTGSREAIGGTSRDPAEARVFVTFGQASTLKLRLNGSWRHAEVVEAGEVREVGGAGGAGGAH